MIKTKKTKIFRKIFFTSTLFFSASIPFITTGTLLKKDYSASYIDATTASNPTIFSVREDGTRGSVSIVDINGENTPPELRRKVINLYKMKPSNVTSIETDNIENEIKKENSSSSIFNLLVFDENKVYSKDEETTTYENAPKVTNLSNANKALNYKSNNPSKYNEDSPLLYFKPIRTVENEQETFKPVTQKLLDQLGVLVLRIDMKDRNSQPVTEYLFLPGFNSNLQRKYTLNTVVLPSEEYKNSVSSLTNAQLESYPEFNNVSPTKRYITKRTNNYKKGNVQYSVMFEYEKPTEIDIDPGKTDISVINNYGENDVVKNIFDRKFEQSFNISGFQPSSNLSQTQMIMIIAGIIGFGFILSLVVYLMSIIVNKVKYGRNKDEY